MTFININLYRLISNFFKIITIDRESISKNYLSNCLHNIWAIFKDIKTKLTKPQLQTHLKWNTIRYQNKYTPLLPACWLFRFLECGFSIYLTCILLLMENHSLPQLRCVDVHAPSPPKNKQTYNHIIGHSY